MNNTITDYIKELYESTYKSNNEETSCVFVSSRGLLKSTDIFDKNPQSSIHYITPGYDFGLLKPNSKVYVGNSALQDFANFFDQLPHPFILISGDCDKTVPYEAFTDATLFTKLVNHPKLIHWFCQNCVIKHSKITKMPIGMDYHTMKTSSVWGPLMSCVEQEQLLMQLSRLSYPFYERRRLCYVNFLHTIDTSYGEKYRRHPLIKIPAELLYIEQNKLNRNDSWINMTKYAFVVSPHGNGLDCHRTWEALLLGCIPIVKRSSIDDLYKDLPVLIVNNWHDITPDLLNTTIDTFKEKCFNYDKLKLSYWVDLQNSKKI